MSRIAVLIASCAYIGYIPFAPGTFGSVPGLVLALVFRQSSTPWWGLWLAALLIGAIGVWAATAAERHFGHKDPGPVVIDEVVGMMITMGNLPLGWGGVLIAFLVFRACDIVKPFPARQMEKLPAGLGVMMDDVMAGVWGLAIMHALVWAVPGWML
jgi:phosphatidylglycerophosphatase A